VGHLGLCVGLEEGGVYNGSKFDGKDWMRFTFDVLADPHISTYFLNKPY
jgi:hypothetical protein